MLGSIDTFLISWLITGQPSIAISITFVELITKITLYWAHERLWGNVKWGVFAPQVGTPTPPVATPDQTSKQTDQ